MEPGDQLYRRDGLAEYLVSMAEAFARFMPDVADVASRTMTFSQMAKFKAGVVEGDVIVGKAGLVYTNEMVPAFADAPLGALFITGSLLAPNATIAEPDIDWSPLLKVKGNVTAKSLCLGGSASEIDGDVTIENTLFGYYNHGQMRIRGRTRARLILVSDYQLIFDGPVEKTYVASSGGRLNIPIDYGSARLDLLLVPEVMDETNFLHDGVVLDRLKRGLPILRPDSEIGRPPPLILSAKGAARLDELRAQKARGEDLSLVSFAECELRFVPDELKEFADARELVLSKNRVGALPAWIGDFAGLEVLRLEDCGLRTLPRDIAALPRLRKLELRDNPITALPFGPESFRKIEILSIGQNYSDESAKFTANLDLSQFPWLRVLEQQYDINTVDELDYRDTDELWNNPHLEILDISWPSFKRGIPAGLLHARNLKALATRVNVAQLGSAVLRLQILEQLEYLSIGYSDMTRTDLARLYDALPRVFISADTIEGKSDTDHPESQKLWDIDSSIRQRHFDVAIAAIDAMVASLNLRRPLLPLKLHARLMTLAVKARRIAALEETDRPRREAMAEATLKWADRVLSALPANAEALWYLDYHAFWLVRLECLYGRATGHALRASPDAAAATAALDLAQSELNRFLGPVNPHWQGNESAIIQNLRLRIPI